MPEPIAVITALAGLAFLGLTFAAIDVVRGLGQFIGTVLMVLLIVLLLNRVDLSTIGNISWDEIINSINYGATARTGWQNIPYLIGDPMIPNDPGLPIRPGEPPIIAPPPLVSRPPSRSQCHLPAVRCQDCGKGARLNFKQEF